MFTAVTGVSGSGKSSLVSQALVELVARAPAATSRAATRTRARSWSAPPVAPVGGRSPAGMEDIGGWSRVDQKPIGRTPRSNLATYTGLFDHVRKLFAATKAARARRYDAGRFSFNVAEGPLRHLPGRGLRHGRAAVPAERVHARARPATARATTRRRWRSTYREQEHRRRAGDDGGRGLGVLRRRAARPPRRSACCATSGLGYLRLGQPATELSGGEAQRIKLATELQRPTRGDTLYVLDEPTTGLHPTDVETLMAQLQGLVDAGNTVVVVEHDMHVVGSDWVIDIGPGAGDEGGKVVATGAPQEVARAPASRTAPYLARYLRR